MSYATAHLMTRKTSRPTRTTTIGIYSVGSSLKVVVSLKLKVRTLKYHTNVSLNVKAGVLKYDLLETLLFPPTPTTIISCTPITATSCLGVSPYA